MSSTAQLQTRAFEAFAVSWIEGMSLHDAFHRHSRPLEAASITVVLYDHFITLDQEVRLK
jgi:hypothetical protein